MKRPHVYIPTLAAVAVALWLLAPWLRQMTAPLGDWLGMAQAMAAQLATWHAGHPFWAAAAYAGVAVFAAATDLPTPSLVQLAGGAVLGFWPAFLIGLPAVGLGALAPFEIARRWIGPFLTRRFPKTAALIRQGVGRDGPLYLVSLRLIPMMPFSATNLFMGLTPVPAWIFAVVTILARIPMTALMCNAGLRLAELRRLDDLLTTRMILTFLGLAACPLILRLAWSRLRPRRNPPEDWRPTP